jgi:hypothetical protein
MQGMFEFQRTYYFVKVLSSEKDPAEIRLIRKSSTWLQVPNLFISAVAAAAVCTRNKIKGCSDRSVCVIGNSFPNCQQPYEMRCNFKGLSRHGGGGGAGGFSKNLHASLFNDDLSNEPNFGRVHLAGQYL